MSKVEYKNTLIKDIGRVVTGKTPKTKKSEFYGNGYMFITPAELHDGYNVQVSDKYITESGLQSIKSNCIDGTSVMVGCIGWDMGNVAICHRKCATNQQINSITDFNPKYNPFYTYYWLLTKKDYLFTIASVTRTPILSKSTFEEIVIPMPDRSIQDNVVGTLKPIDDMMENNKRICSELEAMAKTLSDYWFVQFDFPDENGKPYRTSGGEMVWNKQLKRKIPKEWKPGKLCDIANITMGQSPAGESYNDAGDGLFFYQGRTDFGLRFSTPRMYTTAPTRFAQKGDILLSVRAPVGDLNFAMEDCCIGRGLAALNSKLGSQMHLFYTLAGFQQIFKVMDENGTTFGSITKDRLFDMSVVIPPDEILMCFEKRVKPIESKIEKCEEEIRELTKLRDWLLPMLMNGQARVE